MLKRTITGLLLVAVLVPLLVLGDLYFAVACAFIAYMANHELLVMFSKEEPTFKQLKYTLPIWSAAVLLFGFFESKMIIPGIIMGVLIFLFGMVLNKNIKPSTCFKLIFSYLYGGCLPLVILYLRNLNLWILVLTLTCVMLTDVGGYIFGFLFGKHKLCPTISPKKTVEGAILGTIFGVGCGCALYFVVTKEFNITIFSTFVEMKLPLEIISVISISLMLAVVGQLGDLIASKIKRAYDIKDFGKIFPGHGGVLDRFDSTLIAGAMMFVICYMIGVI